MVTYNVKEASEILGVDRSGIWAKLRAWNVKKVRGQYYITPELLESLKKKPEDGLSAKIKLNKRFGISHFIVRNVATRLGISIKSPELDKAIELYKTGFYTYKGIKHILGL